jgi:2-iminoacetate synthase
VAEAQDWLERFDVDGILERVRRGTPKGASLYLLDKAKSLVRLTLEEAALLLMDPDPEPVYEAAREVKEKVYGKRLVLFAPLYLSNRCANNCLYCGFRRDNSDLPRKTLALDEVARETEALIRQGHKRLLLVAGEGRGGNLNHLEGAIRTVYETKLDHGEIRRVNVNVAPLAVEEFQRLKAAKIGTYQLFQETYHRPTYERMHPSGPKKDYNWRISAMDRALEAGIGDVGIGALFGLYDYRFEVLGLLAHAMHLEEAFGAGPHTISVPRFKPAHGACFSKAPYPVSDESLMRIVAVLRLAVPYTGIILSTREPAGLRDKLFELGISQISAGSRTDVGGYALEKEGEGQFEVDDHRSLDQVICDLCEQDGMPSFCTACYRRGRTGERFMDLARPGEIGELCLPNAILTFEEYLLDYASEGTKGLGERVVARYLKKISSPALLNETSDRLARLTAGERDLYF